MRGGVLVESLGVSRCATTSSSSSSTMRVVVGDVKRSWKRDDVRTGAVLLRELGAGPLVRIGGTTGATNGSEVSKICQTPTRTCQGMIVPVLHQTRPQNAGPLHGLNEVPEYGRPTCGAYAMLEE